MSVPRLAWGYGPRGYDVLARSPDLPSPIEALFLDLAERWPFDDAREGLVLTRCDAKGLGACAVLLRSRMDEGPPAHRQTGFALFRAEEQVAAWAGFLPMLECLPPYAPTGPVLPAVGLPRPAEPAHLAALDPGADPGSAWLTDAWARLVADEVVALPPIAPGREVELIDLVACALPPRLAARLGVAVGLRRTGVLAAGPALEGASAAPRPRSNAPGTAPPEPALEWARRHAAQRAHGGEAALALRAAITALAREEGRDPGGFDAGLVESLALRERAVAWLLGSAATDREAMGWLAAILPDDARVRALERTLLARPRESASPGLPAQRLAWAVRQLEHGLPISPLVATLLGTLSLDGNEGDRMGVVPATAALPPSGPAVKPGAPPSRDGPQSTMGESTNPCTPAPSLDLRASACSNCSVADAAQSDVYHQGATMAVCPNCQHDPGGISSNWMWIYQCNACGKHLCHECGTSTRDGMRCPHCDSEDTEKAYKCFTDS